jgi:hypothetical protein
MGFIHGGPTLPEEPMRNVFALLALLGVAGIVFGILIIVTQAGGPDGVPFTFENYGGPGPLIAGLVLLCGGLYLRSIWPKGT